MLALIALLQAVTIALSGPPTSPEYLALRVAEREGYFKEAGLTVRLVTTRTEPAAAQALAAGTVDLAATSVEALLRFAIRQEGDTPRLVLGLTAAPPVVLAASQRRARPVTSIKDLAGSTVGIARPGAPGQTWLLGVLERAGLRASQVGLTSLGELRLGMALAGGEVGAGLVGEPLASRLLADGRVAVLADLRTPEGSARALGRPTAHAGVFEMAPGRVEVEELTALCGAVLRAIERIRTALPTDLASRLPDEVVGLPEDFAHRLAAAREAYLTDGRVERRVLEETIALIRAHVPLPRSPRIPDADAMLRLEPLARALTRPVGR